MERDGGGRGGLENVHHQVRRVDRGPVRDLPGPGAEDVVEADKPLQVLRAVLVDPDLGVAAAAGTRVDTVEPGIRRAGVAAGPLLERQGGVDDER